MILLLGIEPELAVNLLVEPDKVRVHHRLVGGQVVLMHDHEALHLLLPRFQVDHLEHLELVVMLVPLEAAAGHDLIELFLAILGRPALAGEAVPPGGAPRALGQGDLLENSRLPEFVRTLQKVLDRCLIQAILEMHSAKARIVKSEP